MKQGLGEGGGSTLRGLRKPGIAELTFVGLGLACLLFPAWHSLRNDTAQRVEEARTALSTTAATTLSAIRSWTEERTMRAAWLAERRPVAESVRSVLARSAEDPTDERLDVLHQRFRPPTQGADDAAEFDAFLIIGLNGRVHGASFASWHGAVLGDAAKQLLRQGPARLTPWSEVAPETASSAGLHPLAVVVRVEDERGQPLGGLILRFDAEPHVRAAVARRALGAAGRTRVFHPEKGWIVSTSGVSLNPDECLDDPAMVLKRHRESDPAEGYLDCRGVPVLGAWERHETSGIAILSEIPIDEVAPHGKEILFLLVLTIVLGVGLLFVVLGQTSTERADSPATPRRNTAAWSILTVCLLTTLAAWHTASSRFEEQRRARTVSAMESVRNEMRDRWERHAAGLSALSAGAEVIGPNEGSWQRFLDSLRLRSRFPALDCIALAQLDRESRTLQFPLETSCAEVEVQCPSCDSLSAALLNTFGDEAEARPNGPTIARAPARSRSRNGPGSHLVLVERLTTSPAWEDSDTAFVVARVDMSGLASSAIREAAGQAEMSITMKEDAEETKLFSTMSWLPDGSDSSDVPRLDLDLGGQVLVLRGHPTQARTSIAGDYPSQVLLGGLAISVLLFDIALVLSSTRTRALGIAELMSRRYRDSESRVRSVIEDAPDGILTFTAAGKIETFNPGAERIFDRPRATVAHLYVADLLPVCTPDEVSEIALRDTDESVACEGVRADGSIFPAELRISRLSEGSEASYTAIVRDVSARYHAEELLRESEERYALAARGANDGLWDWNLRSNEIYYSDRWKAMLGIEESEPVSDTPDEWMSRVHPDDIQGLRTELTAHLEGRSPHFECEYRIRHARGGYRWALCRGIAVRENGGLATRIAGSQTDITDRKRAERQLRYDALHDPLTGLPNRSFFMAQVEQARRDAGQEGMFGLMFLDVDRFKVVNDSLGHVVGDRLLVSLSERLKRCLRPGDTISRLGGDEFAILIERLAQVSDATRIAERIQRDLQAPVEVDGREMYANVSIGIALSESGIESTEALLRDADIAMYRAKSRGRARYELFNEQMHRKAVDRLQLETDLRLAVERGEFVLDYQPILHVRGRRITSCEALIRWRHPRRGLIGPGEFIPVAEESGAIAPMTAFVIEEACRQHRRWLDEGLAAPRVSVNISPRQLLQQDLYGTVMEALSRYGLKPDALQLELTESALMESNEATLNPLRELHACGVRILLDDFGTGYSSLVHLHGFPIESIKIDQSFIRRIPEDDSAASITSGMIALAHRLHLGVVAEGAETPEQVAFLLEHECNEIQGYAIGRPQSPDRLTSMLGGDLNPSHYAQQRRRMPA